VHKDAYMKYYFTASMLYTAYAGNIMRHAILHYVKHKQ